MNRIKLLMSKDEIIAAIACKNLRCPELYGKRDDAAYEILRIAEEAKRKAQKARAERGYSQGSGSGYRGGRGGRNNDHR